jgi:hypothetical protein
MGKNHSEAKLSTGIGALGKGFSILLKHPRMLVPLLCVFVVWGVTSSYFEFFFDSEKYSVIEILLLGIGLFLLYSSTLTIASAITLRMIQQHESGRPMSITESIAQIVTHNFLSLFIVSLVWAAINWILALFQALASKGEKTKRREPTAKNIAAHLSGYSGKMSLFEFGMQMAKKLVRLYVFIMLTTIVWENRNFFESLSRAKESVSRQPYFFLAIFAISEAVGLVLFLVPGLLLWADSENLITVSETVYIALIAFAIVAWSIYVYIELILVAEHFMWFKKWELACLKAKDYGFEPKPQDIVMPSLLDEVNDLSHFTYVENKKLERHFEDKAYLEEQRKRKYKGGDYYMKGLIPMIVCGTCMEHQEILSPIDNPKADINRKAPGIQIRCKKCGFQMSIPTLDDLLNKAVKEATS